MKRVTINTNYVWLVFKKGKLEERYLNTLKIIKENPGITNSELSKALKRVKRYAQTRFLENLHYIESRNYPKQLYITQKGMDLIQGERT